MNRLPREKQVHILNLLVEGNTLRSTSRIAKVSINTVTKNMRLMQTIVSLDDDKTILPVETIEYEGNLWLVPEWFLSETEGWRQPRRIIRLTGLDYISFPQGSRIDFGLKNKLPKLLLDCRAPYSEVGAFVVIDNPPLRLPCGVS